MNNRPNPDNPIGPLMYLKSQIKDMSDQKVLALEKDLKSRVQDDFNQQRVSAVFKVIESEKQKRNLS